MLPSPEERSKYSPNLNQHYLQKTGKWKILPNLFPNDIFKRRKRKLASIKNTVAPKHLKLR